MASSYNSIGIVNYSDKDGWITIKVDYSIVNYYKWWIEKFIFKKISTPLYSPHITVLPSKHNGDFRNHKNWKLHDKEVVQFCYNSVIMTDSLVGSRYFWLIVKCPIVSKIREEFGLNPKLKWTEHCTIGFLGN